MSGQYFEFPLFRALGQQYNEQADQNLSSCTNDGILACADQGPFVAADELGL